ncbi:CDP-glycerol glycerophosphotransferase family protein [Mesorhizobium sp. M1338]|uniref:CDP-glycerol glycerophosphotransferase family protein n=1 Tax=unclassified Mesorhizobium TaxID=325217 RepID=UPI00333E0AFA
MVLARSAISLLNRHLPKQAKAVIAGFPDLEDSTIEIARQLVLRQSVSVVVLAEGEVPPSIRRQEPNIDWCSRKSVRGFFHYLTARYIFFTHGLYLSPKPPRSQICINVWHGMPIKRIGYLIGRTPPPSTFGIATSDMFRGLVAKCFGVPDAEILTTGIPRNDVMVRAARRANAIKTQLGIGDKDTKPRLIMWLPTFRQAVRGIVRTDGVAHSSIFGMSDMDTAEFCAFLEEQNCICILKVHPMAPDFPDQIRSDRLRIWREPDLRERGVSLYEMLGAADLLITDASSVYVDYLILDKPVILAFPDLEEYRRSRGFALEPVEDFFAGPVVSDYQQLKSAIAETFEADRYALPRSSVVACFHKHRDDRATTRLLDAVLPQQPAHY